MTDDVVKRELQRQLFKSKLKKDLKSVGEHVAVVAGGLAIFGLVVGIVQLSIMYPLIVLPSLGVLVILGTVGCYLKVRWDVAGRSVERELRCQAEAEAAGVEHRSLNRGFV